MIEIKTKKTFINKKTIFFPDQNVLEKSVKNDNKSLFYVFGNKMEENPFYDKGKTIREVTWIYEIPNEDIFPSLNSTIRNSIRRSEKDGVTISFFDASDISIALLNNFVKACNLMFKLKKMHRKVNRKILLEALKQNNLMISVSYSDSKPISYHVYFCDGNNAILWHSCSTLYSNKVSKNEIGRINRYHHYKDIEYFKSKSYLNYDWGGLSSDKTEEMNGIDSFKTSFPGEMNIYYTWIFTSNRVLRTIYRLR